MLPVIILYAGMAAAFLGLLSMIKPLRWVGIRSRREGGLVFGAGVVLIAAGWIWPASNRQVAVPQTRLDQFMPVYQFNEQHSVRVMASRDDVDRSIKAVTANEILFFRTLTWIRRMGRQMPENVLNPSANSPLLDVVTRSGFVLMADEPGHEMVLAAVVLAPRAGLKRRPAAEDLANVHEPGFAVAMMNFVIEDAGGDACMVRTETRVYASDASAQRQFARYWRLIYPGSALIRRMWLRAIKQRAESGPRATS